MYRVFIIILSASLSNLLFAQKDIDKILIGNWHTCSDEGYTEYYFMDSIAGNYNELLMGGFHMNYKVSRDSLYFGLIGDTLRYTARVVVKNRNTISLIGELGQSDLKRIKKSIITDYDYDCSLKISTHDFLDIVASQFSNRARKSNCSLKLDSITNSLGELDLDYPNWNYQDWADSIYSVDKYLDIDFSYDVIESDSIIKPRINKITKDSENVVVEIITSGRCYSNYDYNVYRYFENTLNLVFREISGECDDNCIIRVKFHLMIKDNQFTNFYFNNKEIR